MRCIHQICSRACCGNFVHVATVHEKRVLHRMGRKVWLVSRRVMEEERGMLRHWQLPRCSHRGRSVAGLFVRGGSCLRHHRPGRLSSARCSTEKCTRSTCSPDFHNRHRYRRSLHEEALRLPASDPTGPMPTGKYKMLIRNQSCRNVCKPHEYLSDMISPCRNQQSSHEKAPTQEHAPIHAEGI